MNALAAVVLQSKIAILEEIGSAGLDSERLARLLESWIESTIGAKAVVCFDSRDQKPKNPSTVSVPLRTADRIVGTLELDIPESQRSSVPPAVLDRLAEQFAVLLDASLRFESAQKQAFLDDLTNLGNRRQLEQTLSELTDRALKEGFPFSILMFDVDHFKRFNDLWGHDVGDRTLKLVADLMRRVFRQEDVICRYGGEEFVVILADRAGREAQETPREAMRFAERLLREADSLMLSDEGGRLLSNITLSGGLATFPWDGQSPLELLRAADRALREAKETGRNRICLAGNRLEATHIIPTVP